MTQTHALWPCSFYTRPPVFLHNARTCAKPRHVQMYMRTCTSCNLHKYKNVKCCTCACIILAMIQKTPLQSWSLVDRDTQALWPCCFCICIVFVRIGAVVSYLYLSCLYTCVILVLYLYLYYLLPPLSTTAEWRRPHWKFNNWFNFLNREGKVRVQKRGRMKMRRVIWKTCIGRWRVPQLELIQ